MHAREYYTRILQFVYLPGCIWSTENLLSSIIPLLDRRIQKATKLYDQKERETLEGNTITVNYRLKKKKMTQGAVI